MSVTIDVITKLDRESVRKLQQQRETLLAQGIENCTEHGLPHLVFEFHNDRE